ncbi:MAG: hypothetical protein AAF648_12000 [Pseudomonadota bacterium]
MDVFTMVVIVVTVGCLTGVISDYLKTRRTEAKNRQSVSDPQLAALEERIRVLEKIVTDERYSLRRELDSLDSSGGLSASDARSARRA